MTYTNSRSKGFMHNFKKHILILCLVFASSFVLGQKNQAIWTGVTLDSDIWFNWNISYEIENRIYFNDASIKEQLFEIKAEYRLAKNIRFDFAYRITNQGEFQSFSELFNRNSISLTLRDKVKRFKFSYRNKLQTNEYTYSRNNYPLKLTSFVDRNRIKTEYNIKRSKLSPMTSFELFSKFEYGFALTKCRTKAGFGYKFSDYLQIDAGYFYEYDFRYMHRFHFFYTKLNLKFDV